MVWDCLWFVVGGKAYAIFALLFGFSFYIMEQNALRRGQDFRLRFCWRMLLLFGFGCFNAAFFCGEVLVLYSIVGFVLPLVCRLKNKTLLIIAAVLMLQPVDWIKMACRFDRQPIHYTRIQLRALLEQLNEDAV